MGARAPNAGRASPLRPRARAASRPPRSWEGGGAAEGSCGGAPCACAANSCHLVRNKSSKDSQNPQGRPHFHPFHSGGVWTSASGAGNRFSVGTEREGWRPRYALRRAARAWALGAPRCTAVSWEGGGGGPDSPFWPSGFGSSLAGLPGADRRWCCSGLPRLCGRGRRPSLLRPTPGRPGLCALRASLGSGCPDPRASRVA